MKNDMKPGNDEFSMATPSLFKRLANSEVVDEEEYEGFYSQKNVKRSFVITIRPNSPTFFPCATMLDTGKCEHDLSSP